MPSWFDDSPFPIAFAVLFGIVFLRAQGTYWIGRAVTAGLLHTRVATWMTSPRMTRAVDALHRWGLPLVTVSFLTVGFQTVVNAAAGLIRMPWLRYTIAMLIGCAAWAAIYATVGIAAFEASLALAARSPWALVGVLAVLLGVLVAVVVMRARSHRREQGGIQVGTTARRSRRTSGPTPSRTPEPTPELTPRRSRVTPMVVTTATRPLDCTAEDSPRGLWRTLGKRVGLTPSRVQIPYPPPPQPAATLAGRS